MIETLSGAVEQLFETEIDCMVDSAVRAEYIELSRAADRIEHRRARLLAAIHHRGIAFENGAASTPAWVQWQTGQRRGEARASLDAGLACETLPLTAKAWAQGEISASAARDLGRPKGHEAAYGEIEETLVGYAAQRNWRDLRAVIAHCKRCADALDERDPSDRNGVQLSPVGDRWALRGDLDDLTGSTIDTALNAAMDDPSPDDLRSPSKRRSDALGEVCRYFIDHANLPIEGGEAPHITVAVPWETLRDGGITETSIPNRFGPSLSPEQLAELLCDCKIGRVIMGPDSQPLDVGREHRTAPKWMRRAIVARDKGCRFPGCDRNPTAAKSTTCTPGTPTAKPASATASCCAASTTASSTNGAGSTPSTASPTPSGNPTAPSSAVPSPPAQRGRAAQKRQRVAPPGSTVERAVAARGVIPVDEPRWRAGRWRAVFSRECDPGVVDASGPPFGRPPGRQLGNELGVGHPVRVALDHEIEDVGGDAQRAAGIASEVPPLRVCSPVSNQNAPSSQMAPMPVTCGLPSGLIVANQQV